MKRTFFLIFLSVLLLCLIGCKNDIKPNERQKHSEDLTSQQTKPETKSVVIKTENCVSPPVSSLDKSFTKYLLNSNSLKQIELANGGQITVPTGAFAFADGTPVQGSVELLYREIRTAAEILASGITMVYNNGVEAIDFQSNGMFEMRAKKDGKQLRLAEGKEIKVEFASYSEESSYDFFYLNEDEDNWNFISTSKPEPNVRKQEKLAAIDEELANLNKPEQPIPFNPEDYIFDLKYNFREFPELRELSAVMWQYAGDSEKLDPEKHPEILDPIWNEVSIIPKENESTYLLDLKNDKDSLKLEVQPVMDGVVLRKANAEFKALLETYEKEYKKASAARRQFAQQADLLRTFNIGQLGIYNYDRQYKLQEAILVDATFNFGDKYSEAAPYQYIYLVPGQGGTVIKYTPETWANLRYDPFDKNVLLSILPDNKVAYFSNSDFKKLVLELNQSAVKYTFDMKIMEGKPSSLDDLEEIMASI